MRKLAYIILPVVLLAVSCQKETLIQDPMEDELILHETIFANMESAPVTKTYLDDNIQTVWESGDQISAFYNRVKNVQYTYEGSTGSRSGSFSRTNNGSANTKTYSYNIAVYPYSSSNNVNGTTISLNLPSTQSYESNSYGSGAATMVAINQSADDKEYYFQNVCGFLVFQIKGDASIESITLEGNNGEKIAGAANVSVSLNDSPSVTMKNNATTSITLACDGVSLSANKNKQFWFAIPPITFTGGFKITIKATDGSTMEKSTTKAITINRNTYYYMQAFEADDFVLNQTVMGITHNLRSFTIPDFSGGFSAGIINWGDNSGSTYSVGASHTYNSASEHTVTITLSPKSTGVTVETIRGISAVDLSRF